MPSGWNRASGRENLNFPALKLPNLDRLPPEARAKMEAAMQHSFTNCITPEQLADPKHGLFQSDAEANCVYDRFSMQDGKIDIRDDVPARRYQATYQDDRDVHLHQL